MYIIRLNQLNLSFMFKKNPVIFKFNFNSCHAYDHRIKRKKSTNSELFHAADNRWRRWK